MKLYIDLGFGNFYYLFTASNNIDSLRTMRETLNRSVHVIDKMKDQQRCFRNKDH